MRRCTAEKVLRDDLGPHGVCPSKTGSLFFRDAAARVHVRATNPAGRANLHETAALGQSQFAIEQMNDMLDYFESRSCRARLISVGPEISTEMKHPF